MLLAGLSGCQKTDYNGKEIRFNARSLPEAVIRRCTMNPGYWQRLAENKEENNSGRSDRQNEG